MSPVAGDDTFTVIGWGSQDIHTDHSLDPGRKGGGESISKGQQPPGSDCEGLAARASHGAAAPAPHRAPGKSGEPSALKTSSIPKLMSREMPDPREHPGGFEDCGSRCVCRKSAAAKPERRSTPAARWWQRAGKRSQAAPGHPAGAERGPGTRPSGDEAAR